MIELFFIIIWCLIGTVTASFLLAGTEANDGDQHLALLGIVIFWPIILPLYGMSVLFRYLKDKIEQRRGF